MKPVQSMKLEIESRSVNEAFARAAVSAFAAQLDPTVEELSDLRTAVSEAVTNCIVHAYRDTVGKIYVTASIETRLYRRIKRNLIIKKQSLEQIADYYLASVRYREKEYSIPSMRYADIVIDNENGFCGMDGFCAGKIREL